MTLNKQIKYLTLEEIKNICNEYYPACRHNGVKCPLFDKTIGCDDIIAVIRSALRHNPDAMEEEIEIKGYEEDE